MVTPRRRVARPRPANASAWIRSSPSRNHSFTSTSLPRGMGPYSPACQDSSVLFRLVSPHSLQTNENNATTELQISSRLRHKGDERPPALTTPTHPFPL